MPARYNRDQIKAEVTCAALLESRGWRVDIQESTQKAIKYRRDDGGIIIVIHHGRGWFDPMSEAKGDVFSLAEYLGAEGFADAIKVVARLVGFTPVEPAWQRRSRKETPLTVERRWGERKCLAHGNAGWAYLTEQRRIPEMVVEMAASAGKLREGPKGSIWAMHEDAGGHITGWEERGPAWRGFSSGGSKSLFRLGQENALRLCMTEAAIDAMSLAALEGCRADSVYASTGGGWAPSTEQLIRRLSSRSGALVVAATDGNDQGDVYAARLRDIATAEGASFLRLWPEAIDWNEQLSQA